MDITIFLISVYCLVDDWLKGQQVRQRGPRPRLADSEVLTMEIVGVFLGIDTDVGLFTYFRRHYGNGFPPCGRWTAPPLLDRRPICGSSKSNFGDI